MAVKSERFLSFTRVLVLGYLLICKPSTSVVLPKEYNDLAWPVLLHGADSTDFTNDKVWKKLSLWLTTFGKQNPMLAEKLEKIFEFINDPAKAGPFVALVLSIYLTKVAFDLYYKRLPQHLEFIKDYRESLRIIHDDEIEPVLEDISGVRDNWHEFQLEKTCKLLMERLEKIHNTLTEMLRKLMAEKLKLKENERYAKTIGIVSGTVVVASIVMAVSFPPAGVALISTSGALSGPVGAGSSYAAAIVIGSVGAFFSWYAWSKSEQMAKELEELQDEAYKYKRDIAAGKSYVHKILS